MTGRAHTKRWIFRAISAVCAALAVSGSTQRARADAASTSIQQGYDLGEIQSPRAIAFGGAQAALGTSTVALYGNPANLPLARVYHFEGNAAISPEARRQSYGAGVVDSSTSRLAGGLGGTWNMQDPDGIHRQWTDVRLALGYALGERFSLGAAGRYLRSDQLVSAGPLSGDQYFSGMPGGPIFNGFTFDLGLTALPFDGMRIGVVGKNLTNPGTGLAPTIVQGGVGYTRDIFAIELDGLADFTTWKGTRGRLMLGGEAFLAAHVPLRLGYRYDDGMKTHAVSGGLGYVDKHWSFEISGRHDIVGDLPSTIIGASLRLFYNAGAGGNDLDTSNDVF